MRYSTAFMLAAHAASVALACTGGAADRIASASAQNGGETSVSRDADASPTEARSADSTSDSGQTNDATSADQFVRFEMVFVGAAGMCTTDPGDTAYPPCKQDALFAVEHDGTFINKDERGEHRATLTEEEFDTFLALVNGPEFTAAIDGESCPTAFEVAVTVRIAFAQSGQREDTAAAGCLGWRSEPHPYSQLRWLLNDFMQKYDKCPTFNPEPRATDPTPPRLCNGCWALDPPICPE